MASHANKAQFLQRVAVRGLAAQAARKEACESASPQIKVTTLPNKTVVATADNSGANRRVSIIFRAGSRYETYESMGAAHMLRVCAGLTTANSSAFGITRNLQQQGLTLLATSDRELVTYTLEGTVANIECGLEYLKDVATLPSFKPWELKTITPRLRYEVSHVPKDVRAMELLHRAAFRTGVANSVYCPKYHVGKLSQDIMNEYFCNTCTTNRCTVVGIGMNPNNLSGFAQCFALDSGDGRSSKSKYYGNSEIRKDRSSDSAHVAIAGEGGSYANMKEAVAFAVLQQVYGTQPFITYGNINGGISSAVNKVLADQRYKFTTINQSFTDTGLFGFLLSTDAKNAGKAVEAAVKVLKSGSVSSNDVNRGKNILKAIILNTFDCGAGQLLAIGRQAALFGAVKTGEELCAEVDSITESDVKNAAKKVAGSKLSMGAVGNLAHVPYVSDLS